MATGPDRVAPGDQRNAATGRSAALDATRALAVVAMVLGHTLDALLASRYKQSSLFLAYSPFRGMTAPLFLFVSGWAVMTRALRQPGWGSGTLVRVHVGRAALLFFWGMVLRWPAWNPAGLWRGDRDLWTHLLGPDALGCIAGCLLISAGLLALSRSARIRGGLWVAVVLAAAWGATVAVRSPLPPPWRGFLMASAESPFPLLPWVGYFGVGACVAVLLQQFRTRSLRALSVLVLGLLLLWSTALLGLDGLPLWSARLFAYRVGFVASVAGVILALPERWIRWSMPVGRASLVTYVVHLPLLYGWGSYAGLKGVWGEALAPGQALALALLFIAAGTLAAGAVRAFPPLRTWPNRLSESQQAEARNEAT